MPGVVAIVMAVIGTFLSSLTIAREWERGTMEQLISTPVTRGEVIAGKLLPYLLIGMFDAVECIVIAVWWFRRTVSGQRPRLLLAASALFLLAVLLLGFLISAATGNQLAASQFSLVLTFLPSFLLSGFAFPIDQMPAVVREYHPGFSRALLRYRAEEPLSQGLRSRRDSWPDGGDGAFCPGGRGADDARLQEEAGVRMVRCSRGSGR